VRKGRQRWRYLLVVAVFGCGMMSKSMLVTLPLVLLLLDWWPLGRFQKTADWRSFIRSTRPLVLEKLPLLALSGMFAAVQVLSAKGAIVPLEAMPLWQRMANALNSYVVYVWQVFSPVDLAAFYPRPESAIPYWETALALAFLLSVTGLIYALREKCPWLGVGWLWYVGMLVPICGVLQAGDMAHADRFTYLPQIGLFIMLTWAGAEFAGRMHLPGWMVGTLAGCVILVLTVMAREQTSYWRNSESLWRHALGCTENNYVAHNSLGNVLQERGELTEAAAHYQKALEIRPDYVGARNNLGEALREMGRLDEAVAQFQRVLQIDPSYAEASNNLGNVLRQMGRMDLAVARFQYALEMKPDYVEARYNLANALRQMDRIEESIAEYQKTLEIRPDYPEAQNNLAYILSVGRDPRLRNGAVAEELALRANELTGGTSPVVLGTLGAAYAEEGRFSEAVETVKRAIPLAEGQGNITLTSTLRKHLELYEAGKPLRDQ
jgi:tetratricopeptide (TPR) repeat protein